MIPVMSVMGFEAFRASLERFLWSEVCTFRNLLWREGLSNQACR
jgi:hypothetical protein